jgi:CRISPR/Cas system type I-B associated protein Csh2 (Cas7 group RAMP superfamily)
MNRCSKTGLTDKDFKTILDVLNVYDPNDIVSHVPAMSTPEFMQDVHEAFKAVLAHVNRAKYGSDMGAFRESSNPKRYADVQDVPECMQLDEHDMKDLQALAHDQYIHGLS